VGRARQTGRNLSDRTPIGAPPRVRGRPDPTHRDSTVHLQGAAPG
jgi:hypothetical protein